MPLPSTKYRVWLNPPEGDAEPLEVVADVRHVDRLTAERSMVPIGISMDLPMNMTTAWAWAALKRSKDYAGPLERFLHVDCLGLEPVEDADDEVPPTEPAATTDSASSSP